MKALSLKQPWAELIVSGKKTIEVRKWNTKFRGEFLVHASKNTDIEREKELGYKNLPTGCIVGKVTLTGVKEYESEEEFNKELNKHFANGFYKKGVKGFILKDAQRLPQKELKGQLNFFDVN